MHSKSYIRTNISLAWPLALNGLLMQSMLMIDTLLVSPLGEISLAAMGIATVIVSFILGIQMALAIGTQLVLSRAVGSAVQESIAKAYWAGFIINLTAALFFWLLLTLFDNNLISLLTDNQSLHKAVNDYISISKYLVLFAALTQVTIALFNSLGNTKIAFKGYLIELPINAIMSYLLIHGLQIPEVISLHGLGVQGAAIGSMIAIIVRMAYLLLNLHYNQAINLSITASARIMQKNIVLHFKEIFPVAANVTMLAVGITVYQLLYSQLSLNAYVAITLVMPWLRAGTQFIAAWSHSSAITISQAIGSRNVDDLSDNVNSSIKVAVVISCLCALFFAIFSVFIADLYPDLDPETYQALSVIAPLYIFLAIPRGYNTVHGNVLRALGKTTAVFKINFTGQWLISIPLCAIIIFVFDGSIFWAFAIQPFEEIVKALPFRYLARKSLKEFDQQKADKLMYE